VPADADAIGCFERAIDILTDEGRFSAAAKHHKELAEIYENELGDRKRASIHYNRAIELYEGEPNSSSYCPPACVLSLNILITQNMGTRSTQGTSSLV